jgi:hypothetical protein
MKDEAQLPTPTIPTLTLFRCMTPLALAAPRNQPPEQVKGPNKLDLSFVP